MVVRYVIAINGECLEPCPRGKSAMVNSCGCQSCEYYRKKIRGVPAIHCVKPRKKKE